MIWESELNVSDELTAYQALLEAARVSALDSDEDELLREDLEKARRRVEIAWLECAAGR